MTCDGVHSSHRYSNQLDARRSLRRPRSEIPPLLARVCPELESGDEFAKERSNPLFLYRKVLVSEEAYLEFSSSSMPGHRVLPAITGVAKRQLMMNSRSLPKLPPRLATSKSTKGVWA